MTEQNRPTQPGTTKTASVVTHETEGDPIGWTIIATGSDGDGEPRIEEVAVSPVRLRVLVDFVCEYLLRRQHRDD